MKVLSHLSKQFAFVVLLGLSVITIVTGCKKDYNNNNNNAYMYTVSGTASGANVVPSVSTTGSGTITGTFNSSTRVFDYNVSWSSLTSTATATAFYTGASGVNGSLIQNLTITTPGISGSAAGKITLTQTQANDLLDGKWYYTVSTATNVNGEVRGQITTAIK